MAKRTTKSPEKLEGGGADRIKNPGWYHVFVNQCLADVTGGSKQTPINGIWAEFATLPGQGEDGKTTQSAFFDPDPIKEFNPDNGLSYDDWKESKEGKAWLMSQKKQLNFLVAVGLVTESKFGTALEYDTDDAVNRQLVLELVVDDRNAEKGWLQINYSNTYHIDDPRVAALVEAKKLTLNQGALNLYPKGFRRDPASFDLEKLGGKKAGSNGSHAGNGNGSHAGGNKSAPASNKATSGVDLDDV